MSNLKGNLGYQQCHCFLCKYVKWVCKLNSATLIEQNVTRKVENNSVHVISFRSYIINKYTLRFLFKYDPHSYNKKSKTN